jgi:hypothetical protein
MSGRASGFAVTITAVDQASKQIDAINKKIADLQRPVQRLQRSIAKFADVSGLASVGRSFERLGRYALQAFQSISRIVEPLAAISGAVSVAGLVRLSTVFGDFGQKLQNAARRAGETTDQLQALQGAARLSGSSGESLTGGMTHLNDALTDVVAGRAPEVAVMMNTLGISFRDAKGGARQAIDVLPELADKIARLKNPALQARVATTLLGGAAEDLLPFLRRGAAGIAEYVQLSRKYGVVTEEGAAKAVALRRAQTELSLAVEGLTNSIGEKLAPILMPVLQGMADWIAVNRQWIATEIGEKVKELRDYLAGIDWKGVGASVQAIIDKVQGFVDALGGARKAAEGFLAFMVTRWAVGMVASVVQVTTAVGVGLVGAFNLAQAAAFRLNAEMQSNPTFRTLTLLLQLYDKLQSGIDLQGLPTDSPLWNAVPPDVQQRYPNSPASHGNAPAQTSPLGSWWQNHAPTWLGGKPQADLAPDIEAEIRQKSAALGLDPDHMVKLAKVEHGGYDKVSPAGAIGPMQLMPGTAADMHVDPRDWHQNITGGLEYYKRQLDRFGGHYELADAAYNAGPDNPGVKYFAATGDPSQLPGETQGYVKDVAGGEPEPPIAKRVADKSAQIPPAPSLPTQPRVAADIAMKEAQLPAPVAPPDVNPLTGEPISSEEMRRAQGGDVGDLIGTAPAAQGDPVNIGGGTGGGDQTVTHKIDGSASVDINLTGAPPGTRTSASTNGPLFDKPRVSVAMPGFGP